MRLIARSPAQEIQSGRKGERRHHPMLSGNAEEFWSGSMRRTMLSRDPESRNKKKP
jgi:hypothetical protein